MMEEGLLREYQEMGGTGFMKEILWRLSSVIDVEPT